MTRPRALSLYRERLAGVRARTAAAVAAAAARSPETGARAAHHAMDAITAGKEPRLACRAGCSFCCHVNVDVTAPELAAIATYVRDHLAAADRRSLEQRLVATVTAGADLTDEGRWAARLPCALLDDGGRCSVYAARPLRCRAFHSIDGEACRAAFQGAPGAEPSIDGPLSRLLDAVESGYDDALEQSAGAPLRLEDGLLPLLLSS